jgi:hypothetical protein
MVSTYPRGPWGRKLAAPGRFVLCALGLAIPACGQTQAREPSDPGQQADIVLTGAVVHTMDPARPSASAVAIRQGRIVHVGSEESVQPFIGDATRIEELDGATILPGMHDSHTHLIWSGTELQDVSLFEAATIDELLAPIAEQAAARPDEPWIRGSGWDASIFEGKLDRAQLDEIAPGRPVYMASADAHSAWVSSAALAAAGITAATPDPPRGRIERDAGGEPTGILREDAIALVTAHIPEYSHAQVDAGLTSAMAEASSYGITSIIEAAAEPWMLDGFQRFAERDALDVRVHAAVHVEPERGVDQLGEIQDLRDRYESPMVQVNAVKLFLDGIIESQTAYMLAPYVDGTNGTPNFTDQALFEVVRAYDAAGFQIHAHVIGDGAVRQVLDAYERVEAERGAADRRPILAHLEVIDEADLARFEALGVYAAFSPLWAYADSYITDLTIPVIGPARSEWLYPMGSVVRAGGALIAGSDWSVSTMDPFDAMEVAVTRIAPDGSVTTPLTPAQRIELQQVLEAYTINGARASFVEDELGSITEGKRADLIVIDRDPFAIDPADLSEIQVLRTLLDGREVYRAPAAGAAPRRSAARPRAQAALSHAAHHP